MKFKKTISAALAAAAFMSSVSVISYAAVDEAMKQALTYVKQRIEIPEELKTFNHSSSVVNNRNRYTFSWSSESDSRWEEISASICGKVITSYNYSYYDNNDESENDYSFGKLTQEEILKKAEDWVKKLNPTVYKNIEIMKDSLNVSVSSNRARVTIRRVSNGIPVNGQSGSMVIDKDTGDLISYNLSWAMGAGFPDPDKAISEAEAIEGFKDEIPVELVYTTEYDYEKKEYIPHLIYRQTKYGQIDALTGKLSTFEESYMDYDSDDTVAEDDAVEEEAGSADNGVSFTEEEIEKMEKEGSLIKAEDALKTLSDMGIFCMGDNPEVEYTHCNYNEFYETYIRYINFSSNDDSYYPIEEPDVEEDVVVEEEVLDGSASVYGSLTINAETGELLNFNTWSGTYSEKALVTEKNSARLLNSYLDKLAGDKADEFTLETPEYSYSDYDKNGNPTKDAVIVSAFGSSPRYAYDIPCLTENVSININGDKKITSYSINYYGIEYPEPENIITEEEAYDSYFEQIDHYLQYRLAIKNKETLTAMVYNTSANLYIDAFTGKRTGYDGREYEESYQGGYTDLEGSEYREIAEKLAMYNITLMDENGCLNADEYITRNEFSNLVSSIGCWYYNRTGGSSKLTRQFAAKILTNNVISEECAEIKGIFKSPFSDVKETNKYVGYIAIANALGLMEGENGKFNPSSKVTRGEALQLVYDYLA